MAVAPKRVSLALQGGGAHGAFTWGVLDRLLEDERVELDGICGTSAGAMNGAMVVYGMMEGGRAGARQMLERFWRRISESWDYSPFKPSWLDFMLDPGGLDFSPLYQGFDALSRLFSPYQFNLLDLNPLRDILLETCDFARVRSCEEIKLFACATNVRSGKIKVFGPGEITPDALLASACLPQIFRAVEIDGEHYWDGGYLGNPAMFPLMYECGASDIVLVQVNPIRVRDVPTTGREITNRVNEISFNATLMREMRATHFITKLIDEDRLKDPNHLRKIYFHIVEAEDVMGKLGASSKFNGAWSFLTQLRALGRHQADQWLAENFSAIGSRSTLDVEGLFL